MTLKCDPHDPLLAKLRRRCTAWSTALCRAWLVTALGGTASSVAAQPAPAATSAAGPAASLMRPAVPSRLADRSLMLDIARAGNRLVSVGERGRVLLSDDAGKTWRQSTGVPVSVTLTAVTFADPRNGWATGHAGVVLHTADAGDTWQLQLDGYKAADLAMKSVAGRPADDPLLRAARQLVADGADKPFLALEFTSARNGIVVGAYGLVFSTQDGGATWVSRIADVDNPGGLHLNAARTIGASTFLAGEKGLLLRSDASGHFTALTSPYDGSWFAVEGLPGGGVVVAGLRGHAHASDDAGATWQKLDVPTGVTLSHASRIGPGLLLFVDQSGAVFALANGRRLQSIALPPAAPVTALTLANDGAVVATTLRGPVRLQIDPNTVMQASASR